MSPREPSRRRGLPLLPMLALIAACGLEREVPDAPPPPPSEPVLTAERSRPARIILFSMDTVRADRVSGYGGDTRTPNLEQIAAEGVLVRDFYAASTYTLPSHMSLFTGLDVVEHGVSDMAVRIGPEVRTLAEALRDAGYTTRGVHEGGWVDGRFGFDRGFDEYRESQQSLVGPGLWPVLEWMRAVGDRPYFLFLHTYRAHHPWGGFGRYRDAHPERGLPSDREIAELRRRYPIEARSGKRAPPEIPEAVRRSCTLYNQMLDDGVDPLGCGDQHLPSDFLGWPHFESDRAALAAAYDAEILRIDRSLGEIRRTLIELGQWEDTLLVITSDHGEAFFEHGLQQHGFVPFEEVLRVPLILSYPQLLRNAPKRVVTGLTWHLDLMPTVLGLAGVPRRGPTRGIDLTDVILGRAAVPQDRVVYPAVLRCCSYRRPLRRVVVAGGLKYVEGHAFFGDESGFLFDLDATPGERVNLRPVRPAEFERLAERAREYTRSLEPRRPVHQETGERLVAGRGADVLPPVDLSERQRAELRALGYLD